MRPSPLPPSCMARGDLGTVSPRGSHRDERGETGQGAGADATHLDQIPSDPERPVVMAESHDPCGKRRADAG